MKLMMTPYDWQEGIGHRAQYAENRLAAGIPVIAISIPAGIVIGTFRIHSRKVFEIYDRLAFSAMGLQADVEATRVGAINFCHQEGYRRSEEDVTVRRLVSAISEPLKTAFGDFRSSPVVVRGVFAELGTTPENDTYYLLDYDGDFTVRRNMGVIAGTDEQSTKIKESLAEETSLTTTEEAMTAIRVAIEKALLDESGESRAGELVFEAALLERTTHKQRRFQLLTQNDY